MCPQPKHIIISGGGTGGHIFPALAIAKELRKRLPGAEFLFIGAKGRMEMEKVPEAGFRIEGLWISGFRRDFSLDNLIFPFKLISSLLKSWKIQRKFRPDVVIGVGGYASGPALRVAGWRGTPVVIQEQNSFPGITNRLLAKKAKKICVAYPGMERYFQKDKIVLTGNPIRREMVELEGKRATAARFFGLDGQKLTVLVVGGSQGALAINKAIQANLDFFQIMELQLVWQTGPAYHPKAQAAVDKMNCPWIKAVPFIREMDLAYTMADIVISRAGAIASAELAAVGKPVVFVPLPTAAEDHQMKNARAFEAKEAAIVVSNDKIKEELPGLLKDLVSDKALRERLSANIRSLAILDAAEKICDEIIELIGT
jgi:UDP-N-acetylglucosamine--N-acetylmuramyl-(pentapeptide) pyrophosphoryl-undecaprenol N-acetylglucosamine transferase